MLSLWAFIVAASPSAHTIMASEPVTEPAASESLVIREGTVIPAISGKIVKLGRRWAFLPTAFPTAASPTAASKIASTSVSADEQADAKTWVLTENLMLQRIVESIRSDASDNRWILSGDVTEFFGENRMEIETAQRGSAG